MENTGEEQNQSSLTSETEIEENGQHHDQGTGVQNGTANANQSDELHSSQSETPNDQTQSLPITIRGHIGTININLNNNENNGADTEYVVRTTELDETFNGEGGIHISGSVDTLNIYTRSRPVYLNVTRSLNPVNIQQSSGIANNGDNGEVRNIQQLFADQGAFNRRLETAMQEVIQRLSPVQDDANQRENVDASTRDSEALADSERSNESSQSDHRQPVRRSRSLRNQTSISTQQLDSSDDATEEPNTCLTGAAALKGGRGSGTETLTTTDEERKRRQNTQSNQQGSRSTSTPPSHVETELNMDESGLETSDDEDCTSSSADNSDQNELSCSASNRDVGDLSEAPNDNEYSGIE